MQFWTISDQLPSGSWICTFTTPYIQEQVILIWSNKMYWIGDTFADEVLELIQALSSKEAFKLLLLFSSCFSCLYIVSLLFSSPITHLFSIFSSLPSSFFLSIFIRYSITSYLYRSTPHFLSSIRWKMGQPWQLHPACRSIGKYSYC